MCFSLHDSPRLRPNRGPKALSLLTVLTDPLGLLEKRPMIEQPTKTMRKLTFNKAPATFCAGLCLAGSTLSAMAQLTPEQAEVARTFFGNRAELALILAGSDSIGGGNFTVEPSRGDDLDFGLSKFGGSGAIGDPRPITDTGMTWQPYVKGVLGYMSGDNRITFGTLNGNAIDESVFAVQFGGGAVLNINDRLSITPSIGVIYGHYESDFDDNNPAGAAAKRFLDVTLDSIGSTPGLAVAYKIPAGSITVNLVSAYTMYATSDMSDEDESHGIKANGTTHVWENKVDVDVPLDWEVWNSKLHTGGFISHTALFGDITDTSNVDNFFTIHPRLVADVWGKMWKVSTIGLGASYYYGDNLTGWDFGIDVNFRF